MDVCTFSHVECFFESGCLSEPKEIDGYIGNMENLITSYRLHFLSSVGGRGDVSLTKNQDCLFKHYSQGATIN